MVISGKNISKVYHGKTLFEDLNFTIQKGEKIGIIGINGSGKSTLLKIIAKQLAPNLPEHRNDIELRWEPKLKVSYLEQDPIYNLDNTIVEQVLISANIEEEYLAKSNLNQLGLSNYQLKISELSGGERRKVALAITLLKDADVLILDEPTNHLDENMTTYLEQQLIKSNKTIIMITHDRYFLDRVTNKIWELDEGKLSCFNGNYQYYCEQKQKLLEMEQSSQRKLLSLFRNEQRWMNQGAKARSSKSKERTERFNNLKQEIVTSYKDELDINSVHSRLGSQVIDIKDLGMKYDNQVLFSDFNYMFTKYDRVGIVGLNGSGKTTLLNIINQQIIPTSGSVVLGSTVKIGYFSQHTYQLPGEETLIEYVRSVAEYIETSDGQITARQLLERFLFPASMFNKKIKLLSGGERRRLFLLGLIMKSPNVLILDEPTNDLDIPTLNVLEQYLDNFRGVVIIVSHDRYFLDKVVDKMFVFTPQKTIELFHGDYSSYVAQYNLQTKQVNNKVAKEKGEKPKANNLQRYKFTYKEQQEFATIDNDIISLEQQISQIDLLIAQSGDDFPKLTDLNQQRLELSENLTYLNRRWEYLYELAEKIEQGLTYQN